jgi:hypothetical protein
MIMNRNQLAQWLGEEESESVALSEIAELLHLMLDASRRPLAIAGAEELREVRFALAVLRDVFPHDDAVRAWLTAPASALNGESPADLLSIGRIQEFVDLAVTEWNRPRAFRPSRRSAMFVRA